MIGPYLRTVFRTNLATLGTIDLATDTNFLRNPRFLKWF
jgi:hypothetical protein